MDYKKDYLPVVKEVVKEKRFIHTLGVIYEAMLFSTIYGENLDKARIAATLHDYTKYLDEDQERYIMMKYYGFDKYKRYPRSIYHGFTAAILAKERLGVDDEEILDAIRYHSIGKVNMTLLEKIIYVADFSEPGRKSEESKRIHDIALKDLDLALYYAMKSVIEDNEKENKEIPKESYDAYEYIKEIIENR